MRLVVAILALSLPSAAIARQYGSEVMDYNLILDGKNVSSSSDFLKCWAIKTRSRPEENPELWFSPFLRNNRNYWRVTVEDYPTIVTLTRVGRDGVAIESINNGKRELTKRQIVEFVHRSLNDGCKQTIRASGAAAAPTYRGRIVLPQFTSRDRKYATYRTRIRQAMLEGPNFATHMTIIEIGCGTGCRVVFAGDVRSGELFDFPLGGDDQQMLDLRYSKESKRVTAFWQDDLCHRNIFDWNGRSFQMVESRDLGNREICFKQ